MQHHVKWKERQSSKKLLTALFRVVMELGIWYKGIAQKWRHIPLHDDFFKGFRQICSIQILLNLNLTYAYKGPIKIFNEYNIKKNVPNGWSQSYYGSV